MLAAFRLSPEIIFLLVAAVLAGVSKIVEVSRQVRRASLERRRREAERTAVVFEETPRTEEEPPPPPRQRLVLPLRPPLQVEVAPLRKVREPPPIEPPPPPPPPPEGLGPVRILRITGRHRAAQHPRGAPFLKRLRSNPKALREAIILREVLGPPYALRHASRRRW